MLGSSSTYLSVCLAGGTGDIISEIGGDTTATLSSLQSVINDMSSFDATTLSNDLTTQWDNLYSHTTAMLHGSLVDINSTSDITILTNAANPSSYSGCTAGTFTSDSWIPSIQAGGSISCQVSGSNVNSSVGCTSRSNIQTSGNGCTGCIDTHYVLDSINGTIQSDLETRYSNSGDCATFASDMANIWTNYYEKKAAVGIILTYFRSFSIDSSITAY